MFDRIRWLWRAWSVYDDAADAAKKEHRMGKALLTSWTFWANLIGGGAQILDQVGGWDKIPQPWGTAIQAVVNILLRYYKTALPITSVLPSMGAAGPSGPAPR